jgi:putative spermidine/putrescine transport system permease protein/spermidine/putrescine transport system permease protein
MTIVSGHVNEHQLKKLDRNERFKLFGLTLPYLGLVSCLIIIPIGWLFYMSFIGKDGSLSLEHYTRMLDSKAYIRIFITTFKISFLTTLICVVIGYPLTYFMSQLPKKVGWGLYDRRSYSILDKFVSTDLCLVSFVTEKGAFK